MAKAKRCLGVDLGGQSVKIAEMAIDRGGLRIVRLIEAPIPVGPEAQQAERNAAIVSVVRDIIKSNKIVTKSAIFSIPGQTVFVKRQMLPRATPSQIARIVQIEARQQIPFPLEKMTLEYQIFDTGEERQVEVLLAAMKRETNQEYMRLFRSTGLRVAGISISSLALFNGQELRRFDARGFEVAGAKKPRKKLPGLGRKKSKKAKETPTDLEAAAAIVPAEESQELGEMPLEGTGEFEEVRAYVNFGARATDLAICKAGGAHSVGFVRSIPIGGNHITQAILRDCDCETFTQAEKIKAERTAVQSAAFEFEADVEAYDPKACAVATTVCDRIIAEIRRSLDYYISQPDGVAVDILALSGGGARLAYLAGYIEERLGLPVEISESIGNDGVKIPPQYEEGFDYSPFRIAVGLATQGLDISPVQIDFLPSDVRGARDLGAQSAELIVLAGMLAGMVFFGSQLGTESMNYWAREAERYEAQVREQQPMKKQMSKLKGDHQMVLDRLRSVADRIEPRDFWLRVLNNIQKIKPPEVLITRIDCVVDEMDPWTAQVKIVAQAEQDQAGLSFVRSLESGLDSYLASEGADKLLKSKARVQSAHFKKQVSEFRIEMYVREPAGNAIVRILPEETPPPSRGGGGGRGGEGGEGGGGGEDNLEGGMR